MKIAILTMFVLLSACNESCFITSANSRTRTQTSGADNTSGAITPPPPAAIADWQSKTADEISNFKDADGKNLFQLNINNPQALKELINKVGAKKAKAMAIEGDKPYLEGDETVATTKSALRIAVEDDNEESLNALLAIPGIEAELGKNINNNSVYFDNPTLLHIAVKKGNAKAFKALIDKDTTLLEKTDRYDKNSKLHTLDNEKIITSLTADQINAKDAQGYTALHWAAATNPSQIDLLAKNPHLDVNILSNDGNTALDLALINIPKYNFEPQLTPEQQNNRDCQNFMRFIGLQYNAANRNQAVDALLNTNKLSDDSINKAALLALNRADNVSFKKLLATNKLQINKKRQSSSSGVYANELVWASLELVFTNMTEIEQLNAITDEKGIRWIAKDYYQENVTKAVKNILIALKDAGLPKEAFSKGILKYENGDDIHWDDFITYRDPLTNKITWYFKDVQDKLIELSK